MTLEGIATKNGMFKNELISKILCSIMLHGILFNLMQLSLMFMFAPLFTDLEPSFFIFKMLFVGRGVKRSWLLRLLRCVLNGLLSMHWSTCGSNVSLFLLSILHLSTESLRMIIRLSCKCDYRWSRGRMVVMLVRKLIFVYRQLFMLVDALNPISRWIAAIALAAGMGVFVLGGSGSVIMSGKVNFTTYMMFPLLAITMVVAVALISPVAEKVDILSLEFLFSFKSNRLEMQPFRISRAMIPLRIRVGSFYYFKQASLLIILATWVENCVLVLLAV
jgi:hypothetical protein